MARASPFIQSAGIVAALALMLVTASPLRAEEQPAGKGASSQTEIQKTEGMGETPLSISRDAPATSELGSRTEKPMKAPESQTFTRGKSLSQQWDEAMLEEIRWQNERSATSF